MSPANRRMRESQLGLAHTAHRLKAEPNDLWPILRFDGSAANNGQPDATGRWGWVLFEADGETAIGVAGGRVIDRPVTNNVAEWQGLYEGLSAACRSPQVFGLRVQGDSNLVVNLLLGRWRAKCPRMADWRDVCLDVLAVARRPWSAEWIARELNRAADAMTR